MFIRVKLVFRATFIKCPLWDAGYHPDQGEQEEEILVPKCPYFPGEVLAIRN